MNLSLKFIEVFKGYKINNYMYICKTIRAIYLLTGIFFTKIKTNINNKYLKDKISERISGICIKIVVGN